MVICADTSFLFSLYGNDIYSPRALAWVHASGTPLTLSSLNEYELANALRFAEFRRAIAPGDAARFWSQFESDLAGGRLISQICNLAQAVQDAKRLSATYTLSNGHRGFDILHIATALNLGATQFLTFDENQKKLATAEGLAVPL
jgi:predicted nucleic acid-binding protein